MSRKSGNRFSEKDMRHVKGAAWPAFRNPPGRRVRFWVLRARQLSFDIIHISNAHKMPQNLLAQFDPPEAKHIFPLARDPNRRWYGVYTIYGTPAYNTQRVPASELPKTFEELAERKEWAGK